MRVMSRVWPTGEGSLWVEMDKSLDISVNFGESPSLEGDRLSFWSPHEGKDGLPPEDPEGAALLGSSKVANSQDEAKTRDIRAAQRGAKGITIYGARMVRNACYLLQQKYGKKRLSFLTTTLPGSPEQTVEAAANWGEITRRFMQALREKLRREGLPGYIVSVTEVQMKRFLATGGMPLHLHLVFVGRPLDNAPWVFTKSWVNECWKTAVTGVTPSLKSLDFAPSTRIERIEKDAAGYLGKYMSKGAAAVDEVIDQNPDLYEFLPRAWYNLTNEMRHTVLENVAYGPVIGTAVESMTQDNNPGYWFEWFKTIPLYDSEGHVIKKFAVFTLTTMGRRSLALPTHPSHLHAMPET